VGLEDDFNETKQIMMIAYLVGILVSSGVTIYMFDRFAKRQNKKIEQAER